MTETIISGSFSAQLRLMYDLKEEGAVALAGLGVDRRKQLFDFLNTDLAKGHSAEVLKKFLNTNTNFRSFYPPQVVSGVQASDGVSLFPLMEGVGSVKELVDQGLQSLSDFIATGAISGMVLGSDYTCKQLVWNPRLDLWEWEYNYTLKEQGGGTRLAGTEIMARFLDELDTAPNSPSGAERIELAKVKPSYRVACLVSRDEEPAA